MSIWLARVLVLAVFAVMYGGEYLVTESTFGKRLALKACGVTSTDTTIIDSAAIDIESLKCVLSNLETKRLIVYGVGIVLGVVIFVIYKMMDRTAEKKSMGEAG